MRWLTLLTSLLALVIAVASLVIVTARSGVPSDPPSPIQPPTPSAAQAPGIVRAQHFQLVDAKGQTRGLFGTASNGTAFLGLLDAAGQERLLMSVRAIPQPDEPVSSTIQAEAFELWDAKGQTRGLLSTEPKGTAFLGLNDAASQLRLALMVDAQPDQKPARGIHGKQRVRANRLVGLTLLDGAETPRAALSLSHTGRGGLDFFTDLENPTSWIRQHDFRILRGENWVPWPPFEVFERVWTPTDVR